MKGEKSNGIWRMRRVCGSVWEGEESKRAVVREASFEKPMQCPREHSNPTSEARRVAGKMDSFQELVTAPKDIS